MPSIPHAAPPAADAAFEARRQRISASFGKQGAMALIGAWLIDVQPGYCAIALTPRPDLAQQHGYVHAGIIATLVDSAGGYAGFTLFPDGASVLSVEFKLNLLAPAKGVITRGDVYAEEGERRTLVAIMQQTLIVIHDKAEA
jgi:uncharacterized protein (TIGR00369 family)